MRFPLLLLTVFLAACAGPTQSMRVIVRDRATHEPVPDALITVRPVHLFMPQRSGVTLDPSPLEGWQAVTIADGSARLTGTLNHPMQLVVIASRYPPLHQHLDNHPAVTGPTPWLTDDGHDPDVTRDDPELEVRVEP